MAPNCPDPPHKPAVADAEEDISFLGAADRTVMVHAPTELGPYRLTKLLGRGGMGEVWQAFDTNLERDVAVKLMRRELLANEEAVKRFAREARAVARLNHPNIVQVYTFGDEQGVLYFVMEMVEGETITQRMKQCGAILLHECVFMLLQAIEGLSYANARGIIHRDIKPSNLMLTPDYRIKIADFGLAKMIEHDTQMTAAGTTMGSPNYMSPEQARGTEADHRSDIYALGISFYQMITGQLPFTAEQPITVLLKQIQEPLPEPVTLQAMENGRVLEVLKKMTAKDPEERYQTYGGLAAAISALAPDVRVKGGHVSTTTMPTPEAAGASAKPAPAPSTAVFGGDAPPAAAASPAAVATERMAGGSAAPPPPPVAAPPTPEPVQGALHSEVGSTKTAMAPPVAPAVPVVRTTLFMIAAAAGTAVLVVIAGLWVFHKMQQDKSPEDPRENVDVRREKPATGTDHPSASTNQAGQPSNTQAAPAQTASTGPAATTVAVSPPVTPAPATQTAVVPVAVQPSPGPETSTQAAIATPPSPGVISPAYTPGPTATPFVATNQELIVGGVLTKSGATVPVRDAQGNQVAVLPAGSRLPYLRLEGSGSNMRYVASYQGQQVYLAYHDAQMPVVAGTGTGNTSPSQLQPTGFTTLVLGTKGGGSGENIEVYRTESISHPLAKFPAGTEVLLLQKGSVMSRVQLPNGKEGYIINGAASPKQ